MAAARAAATPPPREERHEGSSRLDRDRRGTRGGRLRDRGPGSRIGGISGAGARHRSRRGLRGTRSWLPPPPPGRSTPRSRRSSLASMRPRTTGRHRRRWGSRTSSRHASLRTRPPIRSRRPPSAAPSRSSPPATPTRSSGLGTLAAARHDFAAALRWGRRAVRTAPFDADAYGLLGDAQVELGRYRAAFASFQRMVDTRPDLASYARVSYALELRGNVAGAIDAMRAAADVAARPADAAWAAAQVGKLHLGAGRIDRGRGVVPPRPGGGPRLDGGGGRPRARGLGVRGRADGDRRLRATRHAVPVAGARRHPRGPLRSRRGDRGGRRRSSTSSWPRRGSSGRTA